MPCLSLKLVADQHTVEQLLLQFEDQVLAAAASDADAGVSERVAHFETSEQPLYWPRTQLELLVADAAQAEHIHQLLASDERIEHLAAIEPIADTDWVSHIQSQFEPFEIVPGSWITPSWHPHTAQSGEHVLVLDPGLAFGTGSHPTTALCARALHSVLCPGMRVIDYGTGSGVLALLAAQWQAGAVVGVDIDPVAISTAADNAQRNGLTQCQFVATDSPLESAEVVVANILAQPLKALAPLLLSLLKPGGEIILSGLLSEQVAEVQAAYPALWWHACWHQEGWVVLRGSRLGVVDSHCHLNYPGLSDNSALALSQMKQAGVMGLLNISVSLESFEAVLAPALRYPYVWASLGVHPDEDQVSEPSLERLLALGSHPRVVAIGETGLDYYRLSGDFEWQRQRFVRHIEAAKTLGKPLVIHTRSAAADTLQLMQQHKADAIGGVMHCFTETWEVAEAALALGFYISMSGIVTFKNAATVHEVARRVPLDRLLVETDAPFLAPVPHRGQSNQPAYVNLTARHVAQLRGISYETLSAQTTANFFRLFFQHEF